MLQKQNRLQIAFQVDFKYIRKLGLYWKVKRWLFLAVQDLQGAASEVPTH